MASAVRKQIMRNVCALRRMSSIITCSVSQSVGCEAKTSDLSKSVETPATHSDTHSPQTVCAADRVKVTFIKFDNQRITVNGKVGDNLLDVVVNNNVDLDGFGACEGTLACSTCHLIFSKQDYDRIADKATDEELDMLDLATDLSDTSRLGCQVYLTKEFDGLEVRVPAGVNDARAN